MAKPEQKKTVQTATILVKPVDGGEHYIGEYDCNICGKTHLTSWRIKGLMRSHCKDKKKQEVLEVTKVELAR